MRAGFPASHDTDPAGQGWPARPAKLREPPAPPVPSGGDRAASASRGRLFSLGAAVTDGAAFPHLSDVDLVALLLTRGRPRARHWLEAQDLLASTGGLEGLTRADISELRRLPNVDESGATFLAAVLELGRRTAGVRPRRKHRLAAAKDVYEHYRARFGHTSSEEFWVFGLDVRHRLIFEMCVARGSLTGVEVHPREVYRPLIRAAAAAVVLCHNHPSGDPTPSRQDLELTNRLKEVGALCGIAVIDHVVVGAEGYVSFADRGWI